MQSERIVLLDAGHGGVNEWEDYQTWPSKMARYPVGMFSEADLLYYRDGTMNFYEGVFNRDIVNRTAALLDKMRVPYIKLADDVHDTPLQERVRKEWQISSIYGKENVLLISSHANAFNGEARGFEVFTARGYTNSDLHASFYYDTLVNMLPFYWSDLTKRTDTTDGDNDKEADFYVLRNTRCSAFLIEHAFMDNREDVANLLREEVRDMFAYVQAITALNFYKNGHDFELAGFRGRISSIPPNLAIEP